MEEGVVKPGVSEGFSGSLEPDDRFIGLLTATVPDVDDNNTRIPANVQRV